MSSNSLCITLEQLGAPPREFWENELEVFIDPILKKATDAEAITCWLTGRHGPERMILHRLASEIPARIKERCGRNGLDSVHVGSRVHETQVEAGSH